MNNEDKLKAYQNGVTGGGTTNLSYEYMLGRQEYLNNLPKPENTHFGSPTPVIFDIGPVIIGPPASKKATLLALTCIIFVIIIVTSQNIPRSFFGGQSNSTTSPAISKKELVEEKWRTGSDACMKQARLIVPASDRLDWFNTCQAAVWAKNPMPPQDEVAEPSAPRRAR